MMRDLASSVSVDLVTSGLLQSGLSDASRAFNVSSIVPPVCATLAARTLDSCFVFGRRAPIFCPGPVTRRTDLGTSAIRRITAPR